MNLLIITILALNIIAELYWIIRLRKQIDNAKERVVAQFKERCKLERIICKIIEILNSNDFTYDQNNKIKELVADYQSQN